MDWIVIRLGSLSVLGIWRDRAHNNRKRLRTMVSVAIAGLLALMPSKTARAGDSEQLPTTHAAEAHEKEDRRLRQHIAGYATLGAGLSMVAGSWSIWGQVRGDQRSLQSEIVAVDDRIHAYDLSRRNFVSLGATGGLLAAASVPLWLPDVDPSEAALGTPWWSWTSGAVGIGVASLGIVMLARTRDCVDIGCQRRQPWRELGGALIAESTALLALPVTHLLRYALRPRLRNLYTSRAEASASLGQTSVDKAAFKKKARLDALRANVRLDHTGAVLHLRGAF